jgi:hypothetical protein
MALPLVEEVVPRSVVDYHQDLIAVLEPRQHRQNESPRSLNLATEGLASLSSSASYALALPGRGLPL